jgi:hypothetical protein
MSPSIIALNNVIIHECKKKKREKGKKGKKQRKNNE